MDVEVVSWGTGLRDDKKISGTLGEQPIKYGYTTVPKKQREAGYHSLLVSFWQCLGNPLAQLVLLNTMQVKFDCFIRNLKRSVSLLQMWLLSSMVASRASSSRTDHRGVHHKGTDLLTWTSGTNAWRCVHSQHYPKGLTCSAIWCSYGQTHLKAIKQTALNKLHRHRHVSSPLLEPCVCNTPALVKSSISPPLSHSRDALICVSLCVTSSRTA